MEQNKSPKSQIPDKPIQALDSLLQTKYDRERLESWKEKMPIPEEKATPINYRKLVFAISSIAAMALIVITANQLFIKPNQPSNLAETLIESTVIASLDDLNSRGEETTIEDKNAVELLEAIQLLKSNRDEAFQAIEILSEVSATKNRYQMEAIWFNALAHLKVDNRVKAKSELERLSSLSNYQQQKVQSLLEKL